jgi:hypothetical protein
MKPHSLMMVLAALAVLVWSLSVVNSPAQAQDPTPEPSSTVTLPSGDACLDCHAEVVEAHPLTTHAALACEDCHGTFSSDHPRTVSLVADATCTDCHSDPISIYAHDTHPEQTCTDCHQDAPPALALLSLALPVEHQQFVTGDTCAACHDQNAATLAETPLPVLEQSLRQTELEIQELNAELNTANAQSENLAAVQVIQGLVLGAFLGGLATALITWLRGGPK